MFNPASAPPAPAPKTSLQAKLVRAFVGLLAGVVSGTLVIVAGMNILLEGFRAEERQSALVAGLERRGNLLVRNHALALRSLAADNVLSAIRELVEQTVAADDEVVFGVFIDPSGRAWAEVFADFDASALQRVKLTEWAKTSSPSAPPLDISWNGQRFLVFAEPVLDEGDEADADLLEEDDQAQQAPHDTAEGREFLGNSGADAPPEEGHASGDEETSPQRLGTIIYGFSQAHLQSSLLEARAQTQRTLFFTLGLLVLLGVVSMVVAYWRAIQAARRITEPVGELTRVSNAIASGQQVRAHIRSEDEIEVLANAFNHMVQVQEDTTKELEESRNAALEASRLRDEFMANMSHEIRTPMNGVIGMTKLLMSSDLSPQGRRYVEVIDSSAAVLMTIINDILDFSKMQSGKYELHPAPFDPSVSFEDVADLLAPRAHAKGIELILDIRQPFPQRILADSDRLRQIVSNLLSNAIKFTDTGEVATTVWMDGPIEVGARTTLVVEVKDTGIGISEHGLGQLFQAFTQVDGSMVRKHGGTGLGLTISKRLAEMMNGDITVVSELGKGSTFTVRVEVEVCQEPETKQVALQKDALVVEANDRASEVIVHSLRAWGLSATRYPSADEAIAALQHRQFDVAIVGASETISPLTFIIGARNTNWGADVPIILLARHSEEALASTVASEIRAQIGKPARSSELYNELLGLFHGRAGVVGSAEAGDVPLSSGSTKTSAPSESPRTLRGNLLVVDDNEINQFVASEFLQDLGFRVEVADNGQIAVDRVMNTQYDLVFMDCQMPIMDGYAAVREIRAREGDRRHTNIVALTAHAMAGERERVLDAGMDEYLVKPIRPRELKRLLRRFKLLGEDGRAHPSLPTKEVTMNKTTAHLPSVAPVASTSATLVPRGRSPKLIKVFLEHIPIQLEELRRAVEEAHAPDVAASGHKLKSGCRALGATLMGDLAESIEQYGRRGELKDASEAVTKLYAEFEDIRAKLEAELRGVELQSEEKT